MKREDIIVIIIGFLLAAAMLFTVFFGGAKSRHGAGTLPDLGSPHDSGRNTGLSA